MRKKKDSGIVAPFETLSDIAIGTLGVFIILVVFVVIISTLQSSSNESLFKDIIEKNKILSYKNDSANSEFERYKDLNIAENEMNKLRIEFERSKKTMSEVKKALSEKKDNLENNKNRFEEVSSVLNVLEEKKREQANFKVDMKKLNLQLESLIDKQTGYGVDRTGRPHLEYSLAYKNTFPVQDSISIGAMEDSWFVVSETSISVKNFKAFLNSIKYEKKQSFFITYKEANYSNIYYTKPNWLTTWFKELGWTPTKVEEKDGY
jgi:archaellum component FlaC